MIEASMERLKVLLTEASAICAELAKRDGVNAARALTALSEAEMWADCAARAPLTAFTGVTGVFTAGTSQRMNDYSAADTITYQRGLD